MQANSPLDSAAISEGNEPDEDGNDDDDGKPEDKGRSFNNHLLH